jgi:aryl-alcohol dehydrogenase-like predicted oxidoreductase
MPSLPTARLGPADNPGLDCVRVLNGMWQVSGAHGVIDPVYAIEYMVAHHKAGLTTWDLADHYGPAEDLIGAFRKRLGEETDEGALREIQAFTKWVPHPGPMTRPVVEAAIARSRRRMDVETLDLLQFHWWDYGDPRYLDALKQLDELRAEGQIRQLALTNFDTAHLQIIEGSGLHMVSNQVQYSLIDRRPEVRMVEFCQAHGISLLTYGTLCGGLMSEKYLGQPEPRGSVLDTASLQKYKRMIDLWGGWTLFQRLLAMLKEIGDKHGVSIANVATRAILDRPAVAGVIVGVRLGLSDHLQDTLQVFNLTLDDEDRARIAEVLADSRDLFQAIGDCGDEYRA